jgi:hypothetical protein
MSEIAADWKSLLLVEYSKNTFAGELIDGKIQDDRYTIVDDIIYYKGLDISCSRIHSQREDLESRTRRTISRGIQDT